MAPGHSHPLPFAVFVPSPKPAQEAPTAQQQQLPGAQTGSFARVYGLGTML